MLPDNSEFGGRSLDKKKATDFQILDIESAPVLGKGLHRVCYAHPQDDRLCIKVLLPLESKSPLVEAEREARYYKFLQKKGVPWTMLPAFHGEIVTTRGPGYLFDLVRDYDGSVSLTLKDYLSSSRETAAHCETLSRAIDALKAYLLQWKIITMTIKAKNILYQRLGKNDGRLVIVDNIGNSDLIPICNYVDSLAERKIRRKWRRFEAMLIKEYPQNELVRRKFGRTCA
ncbi:MAG: hypothetical protein JW902_09350 [Syntrophaceae bacterium]|nr:hypothetical protein [Syntrophaceae bacterium]